MDDHRNYRFPEFTSTGNIEQLTQYKDVDNTIEQKTEFCNFIYSNSEPQERIQFYHLLSAYKKIGAESTAFFLFFFWSRGVDHEIFLRRFDGAYIENSCSG